MSNSHPRNHSNLFTRPRSNKDHNIANISRYRVYIYKSYLTPADLACRLYQSLNHVVTRVSRLGIHKPLVLIVNFKIRNVFCQSWFRFAFAPSGRFEETQIMTRKYLLTSSKQEFGGRIETIKLYMKMKICMFHIGPSYWLL